jgi:hypothetical protein
MRCGPADSADVLRFADPSTTVCADPIGVVPSLKMTVPVGFPALTVICAVKVTGSPTVDGLVDACNVVLLAACVTVSAT